jgi:aspartate/glutamate racemase
VTFFTSDSLAGGNTSYGCVAGILSLHSTAPRLVGDPVNAQTFDFPVCHAVVEGVTIRDLIQLDGRNMDRIIDVAKGLERRGVRFIATSCGLFAPFHTQIADQLDVPFLSSSLQIVSILRSFMAWGKTVCVFTAHAGLLTEEHLRNSGFSLKDALVKGMEQCPEFSRIVIEGGKNLDAEKFRREVREAAAEVAATGTHIDAVVLECPNLITFRSEIQQVLGAPVFDIVTLIDFFAAGYRLRSFSPQYI